MGIYQLPRLGKDIVIVTMVITHGYSSDKEGFSKIFQQGRKKSPLRGLGYDTGLISRD